MHCTKDITSDLIWLGGSDRRLALFENVYPIPRGVSYNAYLLRDEKTALLDTVDSAIADRFFENLEYALQGRELNYVIVNHMEPDHAATLGAALVFFLKRDLPEKVQKGLSGFAAGVMVAASIWSLLIPALEGAADLGAWSFLPATIGFWLGILFLLLLDRLVPHVHLGGEQEGLRASLPRSMMVALAVALHNLPEGMAVGVVYAGSMQPEQVGSVSFASAFALAVGIALQNVPEGAIVAMPLRQAGMSRKKAFTLGMLSGAVEPLGALLTIGLAAVFAPMMPVMLSFAAGAMLYVVVEELVPEMAQGTHTNVGTVLFAVGFSLMLAMDYIL